MFPLRAFLMLRGVDGEWAVSVHRDFDSVVTGWKDAQTGSTGVLHIGFDRPETSQLNQITGQFPGRFILSGSARFAFLKTGSCAQTPAGEVEGIPFYVAIEGWGYETTAEELGLTFQKNSLIQETPELAKHFVQTSEWLEVADPDLRAILTAYGISDDSSYLLGESRLGSEARYSSGLTRYKILIDHIDPRSPEQLLRILPPWALSWRIEELPFSARIRNSLQREGAHTILDLSRMSDQSLLELRNFGERSLFDLATVLDQAVLSCFEAPGDERESTIGSGPAPVSSSIEDISLISFRMALTKLFATLGEVPRVALQHRMGYETAPMTLQEVGTNLNISRERVRQIVVKVCKRESQNPVWMALATIIRGLLESRDSPLTLAALSVLSERFADCLILAEPLSFVLKEFTESKLHIIDLNGQQCISLLSGLHWQRLIKIGRTLLSGAIDDGWTLGEVRQRAHTLVADWGPELGNALYEEMRKDAIFSGDGVIGTDILVGYGRSAEAVVRAILNASDQPMHYADIESRARELRRPFDIRRVHSAAIEVGLSFGRGTYGLPKHMPVLDEDGLRSAAEEIILAGPSGRQWHCSELLTELAQQGMDGNESLTPYLINLILRQSTVVSYLGKLLWRASLPGKTVRADRIEISRAVEALLSNFGRPMTGDEISEALRQYRGLGLNFQIHPGAGLVRLGPNLWGLASRDFRFNMQERIEIIKNIEDSFNKTGTGLHLSEIPDLLQSSLGEKAKEISSSELATVIELQARGRIRMGEYLYPESWEGPRRVSRQESIRLALEEAAPRGLRAAELRRIASQKLGREVTADGLYGPLSTLGARWNKATTCWQLANHSEEELTPLEISE